ncbi:hypothetical protein GWI33_002415 [Rhynchophorus ferrugineus]|uniref:Uncharacterized protein n=1 Tax=Rhynchophorus ferrugineus TaxID=354439 RepID=A0A834IVG4_RHYFE|nr:hypothetical protein GWI33_002415 [Rhynchophorus ferrugineus]
MHLPPPTSPYIRVAARRPIARDTSWKVAATLETTPSDPPKLRTRKEAGDRRLKQNQEPNNPELCDKNILIGKNLSARSSFGFVFFSSLELFISRNPSDTVSDKPVAHSVLVDLKPKSGFRFGRPFVR